jgi:hypothetical protein
MASADRCGDYGLSRDDGVRLVVNGNDWEAALELAYLYGWKPAGTEAPRTDAWRNHRPSSVGALVWDAKDYFTRHQQHVGPHDARALAQALQRAVVQIELPREESSAGAPTRSSPLSSRATARAEGLSASRRKALGRLATFATEGGFTIAGAR